MIADRARNAPAEAQARAQRERGVDPAAMYSESARRFFEGVPANEWTPKVDPPPRWKRHLTLFGFVVGVLALTFIVSSFAVGQNPFAAWQ